jgi:hypothetical protein
MQPDRHLLEGGTINTAASPLVRLPLSKHKTGMFGWPPPTHAIDNRAHRGLGAVWRLRRHTKQSLHSFGGKTEKVVDILLCEWR